VTSTRLEAKKKLREVCSNHGSFAQWYLRNSQLDIYNLIKRERNPFIEAARRFGKTTSILCFVLEELNQNPGWIARWCFPFKNQAHEVLIEEFAKVQSLCEPANKFHYKVQGSVFVHANGSKCYIRGVNEDRGESARGPASNIIIADEYGFWNEPKYIIQNVLLPQLEGQEGRWLIKASTPPEDLGHVYYEEKERAVRLGRFIQKTIYDKETLTQEELAEIIEESGGIDSPAFRRERLCHPVSDPTLLVIPEYVDTEEGNVVPDDYPRPEFYTPYVGGDSGADDLTGLLFGWYDFLKDEVVIEDEICVAGETTGMITTKAKAKEKELWDTKPPHKRVYDADKQLIFDLYGDYQYPMQMADKADKRAAIHDLRVRVGQRKFKVKAKCKNTRRQLLLGHWKDHKKQDFHRSDGLGHLDCVAAAIYFNRSIDTTLNPVPHNYGLSKFTHHLPPKPFSKATTEERLADLLGSRLRRR
jgi:hypothetical protein